MFLALSIVNVVHITTNTLTRGFHHIFCSFMAEPFALCVCMCARAHVCVCVCFSFYTGGLVLHILVTK